MKFFYVTKKNPICHYERCGSYIGQGELYVLESKKNHQTGKYYGLTFHLDCYIAYMTEFIRKSALHWQDKTKVPIVSRGRKRKYKTKEDAKLIHQLKSLRLYHAQAGNQEALKELDERIADATVRLSLPQV